MSEIREIAGGLDGTAKRIGVVASRFNGRIVEDLLLGALDCLDRHGVAPGDVTVVREPGAWEIPQALAELAADGGVDALDALGVIVRGGRLHVDWTCAECSRGAARG